MLKFSFFTILFTFLFNCGQSQTTFPIQWESKFENDADYWHYTTDNVKYVIGTTKKEVSVLNGESGKPLWKKSFLELAGVKEAKDQQIIEETNTLLFISNQKGPEEIFCVDLETGNKIWSNNQFKNINLGNLIFIPSANCYAVIHKNGITFIDYLTGKEKGSIGGIPGVIGKTAYISSLNQLVIFAYQVNSLKALGSGLQNNLISIDLNTFKVKWNSIIKGVAEIKKFAGKSFSPINWATVGIEKGIGSSNILVDLLVRGDKVIVMMNGLKAFDLSSGNLIWAVDFDLSLDRGLVGSAQMYNAVAEPLFSKNHFYLASFERGRDKSIKKYDIETGKLIWETPINNRKIIIPNLSIINGTLIAQIGGYVNLQGEENNNYFSKWKWEGPFGLKAFDIETGKLTWETEKFDDRITNTLVNNNNLFVADENNLYAININNGEKKFSYALNSAKVGKSQYLFNDLDNVVLLGEDGLASFNNNGNLKYKISAKNTSMNSSDKYGENYYYLSTDDEMIAIELSSGKELGRYTYKKGYVYGIKNSGKSFMLYKDEKVSRFFVK